MHRDVSVAFVVCLKVMRLKAENIALQTNIGDIKQKFDSELKLLRSVVDSVDITESDTRYDIMLPTFQIMYTF